MKHVGISVNVEKNRSTSGTNEPRGINLRNRSSRLACMLGIVVAGVVAIAPGTGFANELTGAGNSSPVRGHAQVVAQSVIDISESTSSWSIDAGSVRPPGSEFVASESGFLVNNGGLILVTDNETGIVQRLAFGESMTVRAGASYQQLPLGEENAEFFLIGIGAGETGELFEGQELHLTGLRDLDLVRDSLEPGEHSGLKVKNGSVIVLATEGAIKIVADGEKSVTLDQGEAAEFGRDVEIAVKNNDPASYVAAVLGEELPSVSIEPSDSESNFNEQTGSDSQEVPAGDQSAGPHVEDTSDPDGDGIGNTIENQIGTDRNAFDTDQDGLDDGVEFFNIGTDPLNPDSDLDSLTDGDEINVYFSDPFNPDSDGDGLVDDEVVRFGTSPNIADSDQDGWGDLEEVLANGQPLIQDTDSDGLLDGEEVLTYGTNPLAADTDGDGVVDLGELSAGTDPLDPSSHP